MLRLCPGRPRTLQPGHVLRSLRTRQLPQIPEATLSDGMAAVFVTLSGLAESGDEMRVVYTDTEDPNE